MPARAQGGSAPPAPAQTGSIASPVPVLAPGVRVRVSDVFGSTFALTGTLRALHGDTLWVVPDDAPRSSVRVLADANHRLEQSIDRHSMALRGALITGAVGLSIGYVIYAARSVGSSIEGAFSGQEQEQESDAPIWIGGGIGLLVGGLVGSTIRGDTWVPVAHPAPLPANPQIGLAGAGPRPLQVRIGLRF